MRIALTGKAGSGKSTVAEWLARERNFKRYSIAEGVRQVVWDLFGVDTWRFKTDHGRTLLQQVGTEGLRAFDDQVWIRQVMAKIGREHPEQNMVVDDVRFPNEAEALRFAGFQIWEVVRPSQLSPLNSGQAEHASELSVADILPDRQIRASTLTQLFAAVRTEVPPSVGREGHHGV